MDEESHTLPVPFCVVTNPPARIPIASELVQRRAQAQVDQYGAYAVAHGEQCVVPVVVASRGFQWQRAA